jgi:RNA polymerase subunit RPABC4/transcription elongation factor Spt4
MHFKSFYLTESKNSYSCKNCNHSWTDKSKVCPKCGSKDVLKESYSDTNSVMSVNRNNSYENQMLNVVK